MVTKSGTYYVYIVQCKDGTLYTGYTNDLAQRLEKHNAGQGAKYTRGRGPIKLAYKRVYKSLSKALKAEIGIKGLTRKQKNTLISNSRELSGT